MRPGETQKQADPPPAPKSSDTPPPAEPPADPPADPAAPAAPGKKAAKAKKAPEIDAASIAREAAKAATTAALSVLPKTTERAAPDPLENLTEDDRNDYEVAKHLASIDPRFKDAPQIFLSNLKKSEDYAARWEQANPGKVFDPNDDEHDEFFQNISTPWSQSQFQNAAIDLLAEKKAEKIRKEQDGRIRSVEATTARSELKPAVEQRFNSTAMSIAQTLGEDIAKTLETSGFEGLGEQDPILGQVLGATLQQLHPFIEAAVHIDDPRIGINPNDPMHKQWSMVVQQGEAAAAGTRDEQGRMFARRADYARMSEAERANHWYLTTDHIIQGAMEYAAEQVQKITEAQKKQLEKLGFTRQTAAKKVTPATQQKTPQETPAPAPATPKPVSPSTASGAKIDAPAEEPTTKEGKLMQQISSILFRR